MEAKHIFLIALFVVVMVGLMVNSVAAEYYDHYSCAHCGGSSSCCRSCCGDMDMEASRFYLMNGKCVCY